MGGASEGHCRPLLLPPGLQEAQYPKPCPHPGDQEAAPEKKWRHLRGPKSPGPAVLGL